MTVAVPSKRMVLFSVCVALVVIAINTTAINTALPAIGDEFDASPGDLTWVVNAYILAVAALVTFGGQLGDVFGKQRAFLTGIAVFAAGAALVAAAPELEFVVLGRVLQGCGAAFLMPATISIISEVFPPAERGSAMGIWGAVAAIAFAIGPLYGGFLTDVLDWRVVFIGDFVFLAIAAFLGITALRGLQRVHGRHPDLLGASVLSAGLFLIVFGVEEAPDWGWGSPAFIAFVAAGILLLAVFAGIELREADPLVHLRLLRIRGYVGGNLATFANAVGLIGLLYFFNLYVQAPSTFDYSPLRASLVLLPYGLTMFVFAFVGGRLADRIGYRIPVVSALLVAAVGFLLSSRFSVHTTEAQLWLPTVLAGVGIGITFSTSTAAGMVAVPDEEAGEAAGLINMFRYLGGVFVITAGAAVFGDSTRAQGIVEGYADASMLMAVSLIAIGLACAWLLSARSDGSQ